MAKSRTVHYHNRAKVLLCYLVVWGLALLLPYLGLSAVYPYKLAGTAPVLSQTIGQLPLPEAARLALQTAALENPDTQTALSEALAARDLAWRYVVGGVILISWGASLLWQLIWRAMYLRPRQGARSAMRAVATYRWSMMGIWVLNAVAAGVLFLVGVRNIGGRTGWDYLLYFGGFVLIPLAAMACFRLAAPPPISGKHAFFKRL